MSGQVYHHLDVGDRNDNILEHFCEEFGHINPIAVMYKVDTFERLVLPIGVSLIDIGPDAGTLLILEFHILFRLQNHRI